MQYAAESRRRALELLSHKGLADYHRLLLEWTGAHKRVLEIGCATGYMTKELVHNGCTVVGVEIDQEAASQARASCETLLIGDAEDYILHYDLQGPFDVVLMADVLEHLIDPWAVLKGLHKHIKTDGRILVSLPNVAFFRSRVNLLLGRWEYQEFGLMDRTHLRFFTFHSFHRLAWTCGYHVHRYTITEGRFPGGRVLAGIPIVKDYFAKFNRHMQRSFPNFCGYHFIYELTPMSSAYAP